MSDQFKILNVPYSSQRDNVYEPWTSCFPTSIAMCMEYCLDQVGKTKKDVGASSAMQLEDYVFQALNDHETKLWMDQNTSRLGAWIWTYQRRYIYTIEEYLFNRLMNPHGFKATFKEGTDYDSACAILEQTQLPAVIGGNFSSVSAVGGHMNALCGFSKVGVKEFIVHDPFGNALTGYKDTKGEYLHYRINFYFTNNAGKMNIIFIQKI